MSGRWLLAVGLCWALLAGGARAAEPVNVIFDTDMDSDCDDLGALAMLHALADQGEVRLLATPVSARHRFSGACVDAINTYFGRPDVPTGIPAATPNKQGSKFAETIAREFPHDYPTEGEQPAALGVYRRTLAAQPDGSVTLITVGDLTNVRDLLVSPADAASPLTGEELARSKVKNWFCMGSRYPADLDPKAWGNFKMDPQATVEAVRKWPGMLTFTGGGTFADLLATGARLKELPPTHPVRRGYELYFQGAVQNRHSADQITVLVAVRGTGKPWDLVTMGHNHIFDNGTHEWRETPDHARQQYISALSAGADPKRVSAEIESLMLHTPKATEGKAR
jgi:hypothetical protein